MTTETKRPGAHSFIAFDVALETIRALRGIVASVRRHDAKLAQQIVEAASSVAANLAEGSRRQGKDRLHFFRIAAGSADETRAHLCVAHAWGWVNEREIDVAMQSLDRQLRLLWGLTR
jgi:four helix bundle protein